MNRFLVLAAVVILAAIAAPSFADDATPTKAEISSALSGARTALDLQLPDYPSAHFRNVSAIVETAPPLTEGQRLRRRILFCGEINAKTAAGEYGGWIAFATTTDSGCGRKVCAVFSKPGWPYCVASLSEWTLAPLPGDYSETITWHGQ
jgi:hypothetical protein